MTCESFVGFSTPQYLAIPESTVYPLERRTSRVYCSSLGTKNTTILANVCALSIVISNLYRVFLRLKVDVVHLVRKQSWKKISDTQKDRN